MSDTQTEIPEDTTDRLKKLKARADLMGLSYAANAGVEKMTKLLAEANKDGDDAVEKETVVAGHATQSLKEKAMKLVRIRISCMNPNKREWDGQFFAVGNRFLGDIRKYVPFDNDEGWHVPQIILTAIQNYRCQIMVEAKDRLGNKTKKAKLIKEFSVEIMDDLSPKELKDLANKQALSHAID